MQWGVRRFGGAVIVIALLAGAGVVGSGRVEAPQLMAHYDPGADAPPAPATPAPLRPVTATATTPFPISSFARTISRKTGIPARAAQAYLAAAGRVAKKQPQCGIGWNTLAAIASVESQHGTLDGRTLGEDGVSTPMIVGPALAPGSGFAAIRPTASYRALHGDARWEHALGPMQFIGSTWDRWASDGDDDGVENPLDIDDAALAAGRYLCASGRPLTRQVWNDAILSYNRDLGYAALVFDRAIVYGEQVG